MKKRLLAMGLAATMLLGMSTAVFAAPENGSTETAITNDIAETYTVTIPATITESDLSTDGLAVTAESNLAAGSKVTIAVPGTVTMALAGVTEATANQKYDLTLTSTPTPLEVTGVNVAETSIGTIKATVPDKTGKEAGSYQGTAKFDFTYSAS